MKKLLSMMLALLITVSISFAQPNSKVSSKPTPTKDAPAPKMKKDGTADMRYKENKEAKAAPTATVGKTKKDGTPDMRYKENKDAKPKK